MPTGLAAAAPASTPTFSRFRKSTSACRGRAGSTRRALSREATGLRAGLRARPRDGAAVATATRSSPAGPIDDVEHPDLPGADGASRAASRSSARTGGVCRWPRPTSRSGPDEQAAAAGGRGRVPAGTDPGPGCCSATSTMRPATWRRDSRRRSAGGAPTCPGRPPPAPHRPRRRQPRPPHRRRSRSCTYRSATTAPLWRPRLRTIPARVRRLNGHDCGAPERMGTGLRRSPRPCRGPLRRGTAWAATS